MSHFFLQTSYSHLIIINNREQIYMYRHIHSPEQFEGQYIHHHFVIWEESMPIDRVGYHLAAAMCSLLMFLIVAVVVMFYDVDVDVDGYYSFSMLMRRCW